MEKHPHRAGRASWWTRLRSGERSVGWRVTVPVAFAAVGLLATTSMINADGTDLRGGRHSSLVGVVADQTDDVETLQLEAQRLQAEVDELTEQVSGGRNEQLQEDLERLEAPAGMTALRGPGLEVSLDDAPRDQAISDQVDPNLLIVHQQDIQAVVNALWAGGAEGISLQGQRIISTTGIKCVGNTVVLQGVPYAPPYEIVAVGNPDKLYNALLTSPQVKNYRDYVRPPYNLGWSLTEGTNLRVPAFSGALGLDYASAASDTGDG